MVRSEFDRTDKDWDVYLICLKYPNLIICGVKNTPHAISYFLDFYRTKFIYGIAGAIRDRLPVLPLGPTF